MQTVRITLHPLAKEIIVPRGSSLIDVLHEFGVEFPCGGKGTCGKCKVKVLQGEIFTKAEHRAKLEVLNLAPDWRLACMSRAEGDLVLEVEQYEAMIQADDTLFSFDSREGFGVAVDLGTTTLVAQLVELSSAKVLAVETALNPQRKWGSDLISRLEAALAGDASELTCLIRKEIGKMILKLIGGRDIFIERVVLVGNTVMQHFFCGYDISPLSFYPFESAELGMSHFSASELEWDMDCRQILFYPSIGSFVGSDILAGIHATGMMGRKEYSVLVDLGTNGEIAVGNCETILCASTAAGPAFEGASISMGMLARTGAIASVERAEDGVSCSVIGNVPARGICGSGLIDAVAVLLENGVLGDFGEIISGDTELALTRHVKLTAKDIQEFQLAKAAIAAGLKILRKKLEITVEQVAHVYIAGAFGNYINLDKMIRTGMMCFSTERFHKLGNTALIGAKMFLFSELDIPEKILAATSHIKLESEEDFQEVFVDNLNFTLPSN